MTTIDKAVKILHDAVIEGAPSARMAERLDAAGLLAKDGYRTAYGVWSRSPDGTEEYDWIRDESRDTATTMARNLRAAGWEAEVIARQVSEPRFATRTLAASHTPRATVE